MNPPKTKEKVIKAWAIVWKHNGEIEEAYDDFEMADVFLSLAGARKYVKRYFCAKHGWKKGDFNRELKILPITIQFK